jgi:tetratricopeptide (TPR) repeat protein
LALIPTSAGGYANRANAKYSLGDLDGAIPDASKAISLNPKFAGNYLIRGQVKYAKGDLDGALADYTQIITLDPKQSWPYVGRGLIRRARHDQGGAMTDFRKAAAEGQFYAFFLVFLTQAEMGERSAGAQELTATLARTTLPGADDWARLIGQLLLGQATYAAVLDQARAAPDASYYQGELQKLAGQRSAAVECFRQAVATARWDFTEYQEAKRELAAMDPGGR